MPYGEEGNLWLRILLIAKLLKATKSSERFMVKGSCFGKRINRAMSKTNAILKRDCVFLFVFVCYPIGHRKGVLAEKG